MRDTGGTTLPNMLPGAGTKHMSEHGGNILEAIARHELPKRTEEPDVSRTCVIRRHVIIPAPGGECTYRARAVLPKWGGGVSTNEAHQARVASVCSEGLGRVMRCLGCGMLPGDGGGTTGHTGA